MFDVSRSSFFREIYGEFFAALKNINLKKSKKLSLQTLIFSCLKFVSCWKRCAVKILEDFTEGEFKKITNKAIKTVGFFCFCLFVCLFVFLVFLTQVTHYLTAVKMKKKIYRLENFRANVFNFTPFSPVEGVFVELPEL